MKNLTFVLILFLASGCVFRASIGKNTSASLNFKRQPFVTLDDGREVAGVVHGDSAIPEPKIEVPEEARNKISLESKVLANRGCKVILKIPSFPPSQSFLRLDLNSMDKRQKGYTFNITYEVPFAEREDLTVTVIELNPGYYSGEASYYRLAEGKWKLLYTGSTNGEPLCIIEAIEERET